MKYTITVAASLLLCVFTPLQAQQSEAEVLLFGVFHFHNPGQDVVRVDQTDVSSPASQRYLESLTTRLCDFKPTTILLEFDREREPEIRQQLAEYLRGELALSVNEFHQIGFRVAQKCGVDQLHGFDESEVGWNAGPLFEYLENSDPELLDSLNVDLQQIQAAETAAHRELDLQGLLIRANDPEQDRLNKDLYLITNVAGAGATFEGADAAARWWRRNFRMYANIQRYAQPGERVLVIAGSGHTAILRDFLEIDRRISAGDIREYL